MFGKKPTVDSIMSGFGKMIDNLNTLIGDCNFRISNDTNSIAALEQRINDSIAESVRAGNVRDKLEDIVGG